MRTLPQCDLADLNRQGQPLAGAGFQARELAASSTPHHRHHARGAHSRGLARLAHQAGETPPPSQAPRAASPALPDPAHSLDVVQALEMDGRALGRLELQASAAPPTPACADGVTQLSLRVPEVMAPPATGCHWGASAGSANPAPPGAPYSSSNSMLRDSGTAGPFRHARRVQGRPGATGRHAGRAGWARQTAWTFQHGR